MAKAPTALTVLAFGLITLLCGAGPAAAQNCGCQSGYCCSQFGFCGTTEPYCGKGCQSGPCWGSTPGSSGGGANVAAVVTDAFFNSIKSQDNGCEGKNFYTRSAFLNAANAYAGFAHGGSEAQGKREIAAFFANVAHETGRESNTSGFLTKCFEFE
jgi:chitinase